MKDLALRVWKILHLPKLWQLGIVRLLEDQFLIGVTGVIFNDKKEILIFNHSYRKIPWALPGGYIKAGEHPREGLEREIQEESGLVVSVDRRYKIRTDRETARIDIVYTGVYISGTFRASKEVTEGGFFPFDKLPHISRGQLLLIERILRKN